MKALVSFTSVLLLTTINLSSTSWAAPKQKKSHKTDSTNYSRPGGVSLRGIGINYEACFVSSYGDTVSSTEYVRELGIAYNTGHDVGMAICTHRQFKYGIEYQAFAEINSTPGEPGDNSAAAAVYFAKDGTQLQFSPVTAGVANKTTVISLTLGPVGVNIPVAASIKGEAKKDDIQDLQFSKQDESAVPHPANASLFLHIETESYVSVSANSGMFLSYCHAQARVCPHTLTNKEGQYVQKNPYTDPDHSAFFFTASK